MGVEPFPCQPLVLVCGRIEYCSEIISKRTSCLIACRHRNGNEKSESAQVVKEGGFKEQVKEIYFKDDGRGQVTLQITPTSTAALGGASPLQYSSLSSAQVTAHSLVAD